MSEHPRLYHRHVPLAALVAAVNAFESDLHYLYTESEAEIELIAFRSPDQNAYHGRAFGPKLEVRWQRVKEGFDMLLLTETELSLPPEWNIVSPDNDTLPCPDSSDEATQVMLWGTHISQLEQPHHLAGEDGDAWIETRIPRPLHYPIMGSPKWVRARVIIYRCQGRPALTRLVSLEGGSNDPEPIW